MGVWRTITREGPERSEFKFEERRKNEEVNAETRNCRLTQKKGDQVWSGFASCKIFNSLHFMVVELHSIHFFQSFKKFLNPFFSSFEKRKQTTFQIIYHS